MKRSNPIERVLAIVVCMLIAFIMGIDMADGIANVGIAIGSVVMVIAATCMIVKR